MRKSAGSLVLLLALAGCGVLTLEEPVTPAPGSPTRAEVTALLDRVRVVAARPRPGGYERGCKAGQGCVFGPAWSDDTDAPGGHDGCDTRNNVLTAQLRAVVHRGRCVVVEGVLADPYTGAEITFRKSEGGRVQIDHVYPLAAAWDMGAAAWTPDRRARFANDLSVNLLATGAATNQAKGDDTPADWLPPARPNHCFYAAKYLTVALDYDLPITAADNARLHEVARACP
ncbi:HNH endonuclease family protein [Nocardia asteroides]|uniref:HNH endonuclease family protein n=1 Tax=Nocardia asteroides TaxID=1824 RepID=UPI001E2E7351|nr:HNH endonuclease family protein [Nocardia asteroides]UGT53739.1 HNH endonuclease family protein [Nocardia asteroides]